MSMVKDGRIKLLQHELSDKNRRGGCKLYLFEYDYLVEIRGMCE